MLITILFYLMCKSVLMSATGFVFFRDLERKVREHMRKTNDYKGWYYVPSDEQKIYIERHLNKEMDAAFGGSS